MQWSWPCFGSCHLLQFIESCHLMLFIDGNFLLFVGGCHLLLFISGQDLCGSDTGGGLCVCLCDGLCGDLCDEHGVSSISNRLGRQFSGVVLLIRHLRWCFTSRWANITLSNIGRWYFYGCRCLDLSFCWAELILWVCQMEEISYYVLNLLSQLLHRINRSPDLNILASSHHSWSCHPLSRP